MLTACASGSGCVDADGDGHFAKDPQLCPQGDDCNDNPNNGGASQHPGLTEICYDTPKLDENCNGTSNCEDQYCWAGQTPQCDEQCDQDDDGHYKRSCGGDDCKDTCSNCYPGFGQGYSEEATGSATCEDDEDNDCDDATDCADSNCAAFPHCLATPTPLPTPPPFPTPTPGSGPGCEPPYGGGTYCSYGTFYDSSSGLCCPGNGDYPGCNTSGLSSACAYNVGDYCACQEYAGFWDGERCDCWLESPIIIDIDGDGFDLTNAANGVSFDMRADGTPDNLGWTAPDSDDVFLVFDRNGNSNIDNGRELFGNVTPQPINPERNGFLALAEYDKPVRGGNDDGKITQADVIFANLRLWRDSNHNGLSGSNELFTLPALGLQDLELNYQLSRRTDMHGNAFRYRAKVKDSQGAQLGRWAWDVFLVNGNSSSRSVFTRDQIFAFAPTTLECPV